MPPKKAVSSEENGAASAESGAHSSPVLKVKDKVPSEGDHRFFIAMIENLVTKPDVNWDGVAKAMGLKDVKCTKERWRQITKKYEFEFQDANASNGTSAKGRGRKPTAVNTDNANVDVDGVEHVPTTPKQKTTRGKKTPVKSADAAVSDKEDIPNEATAATPTKTPRGRKPASSTKKRTSPDGGDEEDGTPAKKKPTPRKPRGPSKKTLEAQAAAMTTAQSEQTSGDAGTASTTNDDIKNVDTEEASNMKDESDSSLSPAPPSIIDAGEN